MNLPITLSTLGTPFGVDGEAYMNEAVRGVQTFGNALGVNFDVKNVGNLGKTSLEEINSGEMLTMFDIKKINHNNRYTLPDRVALIGSGVNLVLTSLGLFYPRGCYAFGSSDVTRSAAMVTTRNLNPKQFGHVVTHELGHLGALVADDKPNHDNRGGLFSGHCINDCVMQLAKPGSEKPDINRDRNHGKFCRDCTTHLAEAGSLLKQL
jgi:predicted Zn-dependent protease